LAGFTQSGPLFDAKTKALAKLLTKALSPAPFNLHPVLIFPTGPHRLRPRDIPGYTAMVGKDGEVGNGEEEEDDDTDAWGWFRKDEATGTYRGFEAGMERIAAAVAEAGGVDGVCGFSQGGATAALVAAALEEPRRQPDASTPSPSVPSQQQQGGQGEQPDWSWVESLRAANGGRPLRFAVIYSGFWAPPAGLQWLYGPQPIQTPSLHFIGSLDSVVDESRSQALVDRCEAPEVVVHPGGHYVPVARDRVMPLVAFLRHLYQKDVDAKASENKGSL
jgi:hypothetical protein